MQKAPVGLAGHFGGPGPAVQQALLAEVPEIRSIVARSGSDDLGLDPMGPNETDTFLVLKPRTRWRGSKEDMATAIRHVMERFPGVVYGFTQPIEMRVSEMLTGTRGDVAIKVFGSDPRRHRARPRRPLRRACARSPARRKSSRPATRACSTSRSRWTARPSVSAGLSSDSPRRRCARRWKASELASVPEGTVPHADPARRRKPAGRTPRCSPACR
ncbi:efflux RND transporter permease subunit [Cupriavidus basilensis]